MSETENKNKDKPLGLSRPGRLQLNKTIESGQVRQNFSHGRSKMVQVEVRKKRTYAQNDTGRLSEVKEEIEVFQDPKENVAAVDDKEATSSSTTVGSQLTNEEKASRARALQDAKFASEKAEVKIDKSTVVPQETDKDSAAIDENEKGLKIKEEAERIERELAAADASAAAQKLENAINGPSELVKSRTKPAAQREEMQKRPIPKKRGDRRRRSGKLTIAEALGDGEERMRSLASVKRKRKTKAENGPFGR